MREKLEENCSLSSFAWCTTTYYAVEIDPFHDRQNSRAKEEKCVVLFVWSRKMNTLHHHSKTCGARTRNEWGGKTQRGEICSFFLPLFSIWVKPFRRKEEEAEEKAGGNDFFFYCVLLLFFSLWQWNKTLALGGFYSHHSRSRKGRRMKRIRWD